MAKKIYVLELHALGRWVPHEYWDDKSEADARLRFYAKVDKRVLRVRRERNIYYGQLKPV